MYREQPISHKVHSLEEQTRKLSDDFTKLRNEPSFRWSLNVAEWHWPLAVVASLYIICSHFSHNDTASAEDPVSFKPTYSNHRCLEEVPKRLDPVPDVPVVSMSMNRPIRLFFNWPLPSPKHQ